MLPNSSHGLNGQGVTLILLRTAVYCRQSCTVRTRGRSKNWEGVLKSKGEKSLRPGLNSDLVTWAGGEHGI